MSILRKLDKTTHLCYVLSILQEVSAIRHYLEETFNEKSTQLLNLFAGPINDLDPL